MKLNTLSELARLDEMAKRSTVDAFLAAAKKEYSVAKLKSLKWPEVKAVATKADILIPPGIVQMKSGRGTWDLSGGAKEEAPKTEKPAAKAEPASGASGGPTKAELKKLVPNTDDSDDIIHWQVSEWEGVLNVHWELTFRRDTHMGALSQYRSKIDRANAIVKSVAEKFSKFMKGEPDYFTQAEAKRQMQHRDSNGDDAYSEYEQSLGGGVKFKVTKASESINEDWGSSDWYPLIKGMTAEIESGQSDIEEAALNAAHTYYSDMGYDSPEDAVPNIVAMYKRRKGITEHVEIVLEATLQSLIKKAMKRGPQLGTLLDGAALTAACEFLGMTAGASVMMMDPSNSAEQAAFKSLQSSAKKMEGGIMGVSLSGGAKFVVSDGKAFGSNQSVKELVEQRSFEAWKNRGQIDEAQNGNKRKIMALANKHALATINGDEVAPIEAKIKALENGAQALRLIRKATKKWNDFAEEAGVGGGAVSKEDMKKVNAILAPLFMTESLVEGSYVVKSSDGVEKRFKDADSAEAKAWKSSTSKKPAKSAKFSHQWWADKEDEDHDAIVPWTKINGYESTDALQKVVDEQGKTNVVDWNSRTGKNMDRDGVPCATAVVRVTFHYTKDDDLGSDKDMEDSQSMIVARNPKKPDTLDFIKYTH